ncbi:putative serine protease K12H4.7 [Eupeodes corollae]|uniref:putative serine protease K12H4.7 n=1 Tax=Eupeodes corollae TaxID=290404 RepID=UPI00248FFE2B|nr:putative serine protease K12H4.7 [Eupeodes corollae]
MTIRITTIVAILVVTTSSCYSSSMYERTFNLLHQEPPPPPSTSRFDVATRWIEQKLDQFNESDARTWKMRYMANEQYFEEGGPVFIFVGGEWAISRGYLTGGHMHDMAKEHKGYLFYTEHRYYGQSRPTSDLQTENLQYLNVKQALADLAHFIRTVKSTTPGMENSKVILTGGSYSATMVTWFKRLYPDLIVGAWASSAPLFAKPDFVEYKEVTGQSIKLVGGEDCYNRIKNGIDLIEQMITDNRAAEMKSLLKICDTFDENNELDVWTFFSQISDVFAGVVQTHSKGNIEGTCKKIMEGKDDLTGMSNYIASFSGSSNCSDVSYEDMILDLKKTDNNPNKMFRQWFYQTCNEYGWYQTSGSTAQPFGKKFPLDLYVKACHDVYGDQFNNKTMHENADKTNEYFGGLNPEVENVYISHGELDPWHAMGITDKDKATMIPLHAHCQDFGSIKSSDTEEMKASKEKIAQLVRDWLST